MRKLAIWPDRRTYPLSMCTCTTALWRPVAAGRQAPTTRLHEVGTQRAPASRSRFLAGLPCCVFIFVLEPLECLT